MTLKPPSSNSGGAQSSFGYVLPRILVIGGILFFGTIVTLDVKLMYETRAIGGFNSEGAPVNSELFKKPWFMVFTMFLGMSFSLPLYFMKKAYLEAKEKSSTSLLPVSTKNNDDDGWVSPSSDALAASLRQLGNEADDAVKYAKYSDLKNKLNHLDSKKQPLLQSPAKKTASQSELVPREVEPKPEERVTSFKLVLRCAFPAICDLLATGLQSAGLMYVSASVFSIFRGSNILITALLSFLFLGTLPTNKKKIGLALVFLALSVVGMAASEPDFLAPIFGDSSSTSSADENIQDSSKDTEDSSANATNAGAVLIGMLLVVSAQFSQGIQYVWEERVMKGGAKIDPLFLLGVEGVTGSLVMLFVVFPVLQYVLPGNDGPNNCLEDTSDTFSKLMLNPDLVQLTLVYIVSIAFLNLCAVNCTKLLSGVIRAIVQNGLRTGSVWVTDLFLFYFVTDNGFGESWNGGWSWLQFSGFALYFIGALTYMDII